MSDLWSGHFVMVTGLTSRSDLNHRAARVLSKSWTEAAQHPGRVPVEMVVGKESMWIKLDNIEGPILDVPAMTAPPYDAMSPEERTETSLQMLKPSKPAPATRAPAPTNPKPERKGYPWGVAAFFEQLLKELPYYHREEMAEIYKGETIKDFRVGEVIDGRNSYEKSLTVSLTKTPCEDSDDEFEGDDDLDQASLPADDCTTKTITLNTYKTPYDNNNAGVWLVDDTGYEHELGGIGTIPCDGGEPVRSFNQASPAHCARVVVGYLVHGWAPWDGD